MSWFRSHKVLSLLIGIIILLLVVVLIAAIIPVHVKPSLGSNPAQSYDEAVARIEAIQSHEADIPDLNPICTTRLLTQGEKTDKVVVFLHGFTSCPEEFEKLGEQFFDRGYNVYIPRMPKHGFQDRLGTALETLTAEELADFATQTADIAQGLGEHVTVSGLSGGGALTVWLAQERSDIDQAVPIAPFLGVGFIPARLNRPFANLLVAAPDLFQWWDPITKEKNPLSSAYQYLRYPTHALAAFLELGYATQTKARSEPPASDSILVITNAADKSINNQVVGEFVKLWQKNGRDVATYQFPAELNQPHDIITPGRPDNDIDLVYPKLLELFKVPPEQEDGKSSTTAGSEKNQETTEDTIAASPLTIESLENAEYPSGYTNSGYAKLENGEYREQAAPGSATEIIIRLTEHVVFGTLDGEQAAAIIIVSDPGGSGTFYDLALVVNKNGQTHTLATTLLGDRIKINSLEFVDNEIIVDMLTHRPDEPMSQATLPVRNHYSFEDGNLILVKTESVENTIGEIN